MTETQNLTTSKSTNDRSFYENLAPLRLTFRLLGRVAPGLTARLALRLFRSQRHHATPRREKRWLEQASRFQVGTGTDRLTAWSWGDGPTVLLVHGWEGRGSQMGAFAGALVEAGFRVVTFDGPAHGDSAGRQSSLPEMAAAVRVLADKAGPLHGVITHSFGGAATVWAMRQGLAIDRLVLIAPPADLDEYVDYFCSLLGFSDEVRARMIRLLEQRFAVHWDEVRAATLRSQPGTELLVVHDHDDTDSSIRNGSAVVSAWPSGRLVATHGLGHRRILRDPEVVRLAVGFIARSPGDSDAAVAQSIEPRKVAGIAAA